MSFLGFVWLLFKFVLTGLASLLFLGVAASVYSLLGLVIAKKSKVAEFIIVALSHIYFLYFWLLIGAVYIEFANVGSLRTNIPKWIFIVGGYLLILLMVRTTKKELSSDRKKIDKTELADAITNRKLSNKFNPQLYSTMISLASLRTNYGATIGFWLFLFFPQFIDYLYFGRVNQFVSWVISF